VAGLENLAASRLLRRAFGRCRATKPASRAARMAPTPAFAAAWDKRAPTGSLTGQ
jgi:hypothetical protein